MIFCFVCFVAFCFFWSVLLYSTLLCSTSLLLLLFLLLIVLIPVPILVMVGVIVVILVVPFHCVVPYSTLSNQLTLHLYLSYIVPNYTGVYMSGGPTHPVIVTIRDNKRIILGYYSFPILPLYQGGGGPPNVYIHIHTYIHIHIYLHIYIHIYIYMRVYRLT